MKSKSSVNFNQIYCGIQQLFLWVAFSHYPKIKKYQECSEIVVFIIKNESLGSFDIQITNISMNRGKWKQLIWNQRLNDKISSLLKYIIICKFFTVHVYKNKRVIFLWGAFWIKISKNIGTLNVWPKFECQNSSYKHDLELIIFCHVYKARAVFLFAIKLLWRNYNLS